MAARGDLRSACVHCQMYKENMIMFAVMNVAGKCAQRERCKNTEPKKNE